MIQRVSFLWPLLKAAVIAMVVWNSWLICDDFTSYLWPTTLGDPVESQTAYAFWSSSRVQGYDRFRETFSYNLKGQPYTSHTDWVYRTNDLKDPIHNWRDIDLPGGNPRWQEGKLVVHYHPLLPMIATIAPGSCAEQHIEGFCYGAFMIVIGMLISYGPLARLSNSATPPNQTESETTLPVDEI